MKSKYIDIYIVNIKFNNSLKQVAHKIGFELSFTPTYVNMHFRISLSKKSKPSYYQSDHICNDQISV